MNEKRELIDWKIGKFTTDYIIVNATDEKDIDGANHKYEIFVHSASAGNPAEIVSYLELNFQKGGLQETGPNGISDQALLGIVMDRMCGFQKGPYACEENDTIINLLDQVAGVMKQRYADRAARGVEGERKV